MAKVREIFKETYSKGTVTMSNAKAAALIGTDKAHCIVEAIGDMSNGESFVTLRIYYDADEGKKALDAVPE